MCSSDIFLGLLAILFPPIAVWIKVGICSADSLINILLCTLGYLPGLLHAWYIISLYPEPDESGRGDYITVDSENSPGAPTQHSNNRVTYYYVNRTEADGEGLNAAGRPVVYGTVAGIPAQQPKPQGGMRRPELGRGGVGAQGSAGGDDGQVPPSYDQAVAGDHKVQR